MSATCLKKAGSGEHVIRGIVTHFTTDHVVWQKVSTGYKTSITECFRSPNSYPVCGHTIQVNNLTTEMKTHV